MVFERLMVSLLIKKLRLNIKAIYDIIICRNLKERLIIFTVLSIIIPVVITSYTILYYSKSVINGESIVMVQNTIEQVSQSVDEMLKGQIYNVSSMLMYDDSIYKLLVTKSYDKSVDKKREKSIDEILLTEKLTAQYLSPFDNIKIAALYGKNKELFNISFTPNDNNRIIDKVKEIETLSKEKNLIVQWYPMQENYFSEIKLDNLRERYVEIASRAIFRPETGEYVGIMIFTLFEEAIFEKYSSVKLGKTGELFVIDGKGRLVSHQNKEKLANPVMDEDLIRSVLNNKNHVLTLTKNHMSMLVINKVSSVNGWITVGVVPIAEITNKVNKIFSVVIFITFFSLAVSITLILFTANGIVNPIRVIIKAMEEVEKGNLDVTVNIKGEYETSNLGKYFNSMLSRIKHLIQEEYELEKKKKEAEFNVLMAQINPHFLYNTLEAIVWKARSVKAFEISEMASSLGKLFRIAINRGTVIVPVREEIEHVKAYINIQKIRYGNKFDFAIHIKDENIVNYKMLKLVLQPLVENALSHGIEPKKSGGMITLSVEVKDEILIINVSDNGMGISNEKLEELNKGLHTASVESFDSSNCYHQGGIGLKNIHDRIRLYYGDSYGLKIKTNEEKGTTVTVITPVIL